MLVRITKTEIADGRVASDTDCPVALGMQNAGYTRVKVSRQTLSWVDANHKSRTIFTPKKVADFIAAFDTSRALAKPFSFRLPD